MEKVFLNSTDKVQDFIDSINLKDPESNMLKAFLEITGYNEDYDKNDFIILAYYLDFILDRENVIIDSKIQSPKYTFMDKLKDLYNIYSTYILSDMSDTPLQIHACRRVSIYDDSYDEDVNGNPEPPFVIYVDSPVSKNIYTFIRLMEGMSKILETEDLWYDETWIDTDGYEDSEKRCTLRGFLTYRYFETFDSY